MGSTGTDRVEWLQAGSQPVKGAKQLPNLLLLSPLNKKAATSPGTCLPVPVWA